MTAVRTSASSRSSAAAEKCPVPSPPAGHVPSLVRNLRAAHQVHPSHPDLGGGLGVQYPPDAGRGLPTAHHRDHRRGNPPVRDNPTHRAIGSSARGTAQADPPQHTGVPAGRPAQDHLHPSSRATMPNPQQCSDRRRGEAHYVGHVDNQRAGPALQQGAQPSARRPRACASGRRHEDATRRGSVASAVAGSGRCRATAPIPAGPGPLACPCPVVGLRRPPPSQRGVTVVPAMTLQPDDDPQTRYEHFSAPGCAPPHMGVFMSSCHRRSPWHTRSRGGERFKCSPSLPKHSSVMQRVTGHPTMERTSGLRIACRGHASEPLAGAGGGQGPLPGRTGCWSGDGARLYLEPGAARNGSKAASWTPSPIRKAGSSSS